MSLLVQAWAEAYMQKHPGSEISVQGGGSGTGISALVNGTTDVCMASRAMSGKEIGQCKERNFVPASHDVALDGVSIAVHSSNPVVSLTLDQLKAIYSGKVKNWKQVGGHDAPVLVLSRESSSGTYVYFKQHVLENENYAATCLLMPSTKAIQSEITSNPNAIGYGGVAHFKGKRNVKIVHVAREKGGASLYPSDENVQSGKYPISRPLYLYTAGKAKGEIADFIKFCLSSEGQKIVARVGYVPIK